MTTEQREAIDRLDYLLKKGKYGVVGKMLLYEDYYMLKNVLEVVENQEQKIIKQLEENKNKDRQIDLMAEYISNLDIDEDFCKEQADNNCYDINRGAKCKDCIKQYFEKQVEEKGEEKCQIGVKEL